MANILIVEDERSVRQALRFEFEDEGYEVLYATDYPEAVSAFNAFDCDMVISDLFLSQGDGIQFLDLVKNAEKHVPFIAMTAFPETKLATKAKSLLKDRFFVKPFDTRVIKDKVNEILKSRSTMDAARINIHATT